MADNENPLSEINWQTILSSFDDPLTLLQWLKKIVEEQGTETITSLDIEAVEAGKVKFVITFENGDTIESDNFSYVTPSALSTAIASCLASAKDYTDTSVAGKLDKDTSETTYDQAYIKNADGTQGNMRITPSKSNYPAIVMRNSSGYFTVNEPTADAHPATKKYVDDKVATKSTVSGTNDGTYWLTLTVDGTTYAIGGGGGGSTAWGAIVGTLSNQTDLQNALDGKLDKVTTVTTRAKAYVKNPDGTQGLIEVSDDNFNDTIAQRNNKGQILVSAPTGNLHAATKKYVDDGLAGKSVVSGTDDGTNWQTITIDGTTKNISSGGGGTQLYRHNILISTTANKVSFQIISSSSTAYTNATLVNYFGTNASKKISASGANYSNSRVKTAYQVSGSDATHISIYVIFDSDGSVDTDEIDVLYSNLTVTDTVEALV